MAESSVGKVCRICKKHLPYTEFSKSKRRSDGYNQLCKACDKEKNKKRYSENREEILTKLAETRRRNKDTRREYGADYYKKNREEIRRKAKEKRAASREARARITAAKRAALKCEREERARLKAEEKQRRKAAALSGPRECNSCHQVKPRDSFEQGRGKCRACRLPLKRKHYADRAHIVAARRSARYAEDIEYKLQKAVRGRFRRALKGKRKTSKTFALLGYTVEALRAHIERTWRRGWNWENYGKIWEIDHILPCAMFDHTDIEQVRQCWALSNLRAYPVAKNRGKQARRLELL